MLKKTSVRWLIAVVALVLPLTLPAAEKEYNHKTHDDHGAMHHGMQQHKHETPHSAPIGESAQAENPSHETMPPYTSGHHDGREAQHGLHGHRHDKWIAPPPEYAGKRSMRWADAAAIARGERLFQTYCQVCHGVAGTGTGPGAKALAHPPADLTNHFHRAPGDGDAYLFWRVSEGGTVEPFKSLQSAMPAFKTVLSEDQRWDVLAYVHAYFHLGLATWHSENHQAKGQ